MSWVAVAVVGAAVIGGAIQSDASKSASNKQAGAQARAIEAQQGALSFSAGRTQPTVNLGDAAGVEIARLLGLAVPDAGIQNEVSDLNLALEDIDKIIAAGPQKVPGSGGSKGGLLGGIKGAIKGGLVGDPGTGAVLGDIKGRKGRTGPFDLAALNAERQGILDKIAEAEGRQESHLASTPDRMSELEHINPLVSFLRDEGFEGIQEAAAARGSLGSGGLLKDLTEFNTNLTTTVVPQLQQQRFNQLANILGIGSNAATGQGNQAIQTAIGTSNNLANIGNIQAQEARNQAGIATNTLGNVVSAFGAQQGGGFQQQSPPPQQSASTQNPNQFEAFA